MIAIFMAIVNMIWAQATLRGKVLDGNSQKPLAGATVAFEGGKNSVTDEKGAFTLPCDAKGLLKISYVGYQSSSQRIIDCDKTVSILLFPASQEELQNVEITATTSNNKALLYQPVSIAKLGLTEIRRGNGLFMDDAINTNIPGMSMSRRTVSAGQQFNIRGYGNGIRGTNGASSNFDGQGYKVYLNGIPITDAEGITLMDDIDFGSVGGVEVVKGPAGTLYGLAISGVVNLKTIRPPAGQTTVGQDVMVGSYGLQRYTTHLTIGGERSSLLVNYGYQKSDGFMLHSESTKKFANAIGHFEVNSKQIISFYFGYTDSYEQRSGELTLDQWAKGDISGNPEYIKRNAHSNVVGFRAGVSHTYAFSNKVSNTTTVFGTGLTTSASSAGGWTDKLPVHYGLRSTFDTKFKLGDNITLTGITGVEAQGQNAQTMGYNMVPNPTDPNGYWIVGAMRSNQRTRTATSSLFTEWSLALPHDLSITAGIGVSNMLIQLNDRFYVANNTKPTFFENTYNGLTSPRLAVNKVFSKQLSAYASYSKGFKAPVSSYFFIPVTGQVNTNLKSEIGTQYEIGTKGSLFRDRFSYQLAVFNAIFDDKMTAVAVPLSNGNATAYSYVANGGRQNHKGLEVMASYSLFSRKDGFITLLRPFGNLAISNFKYEDFRFQRLNNPATSISEVDFSGKQVAGVPRYTANLGVDLNTKPGLYANITYSYKDKFPITGDNIYWTSAFNLLNGKVGWQRQVGKHINFDAFFGVNNITSVQYPLMVFVNQLPDAYLPGPFEINYFGGVNLKYIL